LLDASPKEIAKRLPRVLGDIDEIPRTCTATANGMVNKITKVIAKMSEDEIASGAKQVQWKPFNVINDNAIIWFI
jgi:hypothetical protein